MILIRRPNPDEVNMNLAQEVERLAKLYAEGALTTEEFTKAKAQLLSAPAFSKFPVKGIRRESPRKFCGLPLWAIAIGADWERGEIRGHARGIFAFGDIATGWFAFGGLARGGGACGYYALGRGAVGVHTVSGAHQDSAALDFFRQHFPWLTKEIMRTR
jgi:hypothetical protein